MRGRGDRDRRHQGERQRLPARHARLRADRARDPRARPARVDAEEDEQFGDKRGDELPPELATAQGRRGWLREAKRRLDAERAEEARPIPASRPARLKESKRRLEQELDVECRANAAYEAYRARGRMKDGRRFGRPPDPYQPPATPAGKINVTDPDSRNVKTSRGWVQGYNAQAVCTERQIVIAAEVTVDSPDFGHLQPMVAATETELAAAGITASPEVVLADAGYWHSEQMQQLTGRGTVVLIPPDAGKRKGARPGWDGGLYAFMRRVLATEPGRRALRQAPRHDRADLRPDEVQPPLRSLPTPRQSRLPLGMATDHRHPQPAQALAPPQRADAGLRARPAAGGRFRGSASLPTAATARRGANTFTQQPPREANWLTTRARAHLFRRELRPRPDRRSAERGWEAAASLRLSAR